MKFYEAYLIFFFDIVMRGICHCNNTISGCTLANNYRSLTRYMSISSVAGHERASNYVSA
jgi:hypothetical protein